MHRSPQTPPSLLSPLRYPGGKGRLYELILALITTNQCSGGFYYEPFAGGAACGLRLLFDNVVKKFFLNDADPCIYSFWRAALEETELFLKKIHEIPLTIESWTAQKKIWKNNTEYSVLDVGFATFFLNRCNRSGIIANSGPIGGYDQLGKWKITARFNKKSLMQRIETLAQKKSDILLSNLDIIQFIKLHKNGLSRKNAFIFLDPPYFSAGTRLYFNTFNREDHVTLAEYLKKLNSVKWLLTYDKNDFIRALYSWSVSYIVPISYSLQNKRSSAEYMFASQLIEFPRHHG